MTITQEVYKIATSTEGLRDPYAMTLRIVTAFADDTTCSLKEESKRSTRGGSFDNWDPQGSKHLRNDM